MAAPRCRFNEAVSFVVTCETQDEIDYYWSKLTEGGSEVQCGWLKDKFGLSWQIVPRAHLGEFSEDFEGDAGHDEDEEARHRGTGTRRAKLKMRTRRSFEF